MINPIGERTGTPSELALLFVLFALPAPAVSAQPAEGSPGRISAAVTPGIAFGRHLGANYSAPDASSIGVQLELSNGGALALTLDAAGWDFAVACLTFETSCGTRAMSGVAGVRYAPGFAAFGRAVPYLGGGGGLMLWNNGDLGLAGVVRAGLDIGLRRHMAIRVETRYQPMSQNGRNEWTGRKWVDVEQFLVIAIGLRVGGIW